MKSARDGAKAECEKQEPKKIEVTKDVVEDIGLKIRDYEYQIENFKKAIAYREGEIDAWKKILAAIVVKEAPKDD